MKGKITHYNKRELRDEILSRMESLDTDDEEIKNEDLLKDFEDLNKHKKVVKK